MYGLEINRSSPLSISKQLQNQIRKAILDGKLIAGERLPSSRSMANEMGISRNTVIQVYEQLIAEGYLTSTEGSGTYVVDIGKYTQSHNETILYNQNEVHRMDNCISISFNAGSPDSSLFPKTIWSKLLKQACMEEEDEADAYCNFVGKEKLQRAICDYVYRVKGIVCDYHQIIITPGTSGGVELIAKTFKKYFKKVVLEDPCIHFVTNNFSNYDYEILPVSVDAQGIQVDALNEIPKTDLIYVVPSHQFPMGGVLPVARRIALLQYAKKQNAYVIEDDYDCEFRYKGEPIQPLRNLDLERVIYLGSFSKIFSPSLRIGYMIMPHHLCDIVTRQMELSNMWVNSTLQLALAEFLELKYLDKHIYKMKRVYEKKRLHLIKCIEREFGDHARVSGEYAGLHLLFQYNREFTDRDIQSLDDVGVIVDFVENYSIKKGNHKNELVLGYGELSYSEIEEGVKRLRIALEHQ